LLFNHNSLGQLVWIALIPYMAALPRLPGKHVFWGTYTFGFLWYYLSLWWLHTITIFNIFIPLAIIAVALYCTLYFLLFAYPAVWVMRRLPVWISPWLCALLWTGMEYTRTLGDVAFPWNFTAHALATVDGPVTGYLNLCQFGGTYLVSFLIVLINCTLAVCASAGLSRKRSSCSGLTISVCVVIGLMLALWAVAQRSASDQRPASSTVSVALIQPGISQVTKWDANMGKPGDTPEQYRARFAATESEMSRSLGKLIGRAAAESSPSLYVLPESSFLSAYFVYQTDVHRDLEQLSRKLNASVFLGADARIPYELYESWKSRGRRILGKDDVATTFDFPTIPVRVDVTGTTVSDFDLEPPMASLNATWLITPEHGLMHNTYGKIQLVPFGETVPLVGGYEWVRNTALAGGFLPGMEHTIFQHQGTKFGAVVCFESSFPYLTNTLAGSGAQMLVVLTNDAWYDPKYLIDQGGLLGHLFRLPGVRTLASAGPKQHFIHSRLRGLETRLPVIRAANNGISAVLLPDGTMSPKLPYSTEGHLIVNVPVEANPTLTFYARWGDWFARGCVAILAFAWAFLLRLRFRAARKIVG